MYIERKKAIKALIGWDTDPTDEEIKYTLKEIPAAEVAPVVRCKNCINCEEVKKKNGEVYFYKCGFHQIEIEPDDFCSYGERIDRKQEDT